MFIKNPVLVFAALLTAALIGAAEAQWGQLIISSTVACTTTWNPSDKDAAVTLSGSNNTATQNSASSSFRGVRATTSHSTGKYYYEILTVGADNSSGWIGGIADATQVTSSYPGSSTHSVGCQRGPAAGNRTLYYNGGAQATNSCSNTYSTDVLEIAVDLGGNLWWSRDTSSSNWNSDAGADPATGTNGQALHIAGGSTAVFPMWAGFDSGSGATDAATLNTGCSAFTGTVPSGFTAWN